MVKKFFLTLFLPWRKMRALLPIEDKDETDATFE
jgi:hypothetical protein